jgi:hypothetical protein
MTATEQCTKAKLHLGHESLKDKKIHIFHPKWGWHEGTDAK